MSNFLEDITDPDKAYLTIDQNTEEWYKMRLGRFTASEIYKLMTTAKRPMTAKELEAAKKSGSKARTIEDATILSDGAITYVKMKVAEILTGESSSTPMSYALAHGKNMEPMAVTHFSEVMGVEVQPAVFIPFSTIAGGSPDGLVGDNAILEVKCPYEAKNQVDYLLIKSPLELFVSNPEYWYQCQANLLFSKREFCYFATYDPRFQDDKHKMKILEIRPDVNDQDRILKKIEAAQKMKDEILDSLK